jgi:hypothetical protein
MSKNDNILDAVDKNTGSRTCPECGYQFSVLLFVKRYVMKFGFPKWTCESGLPVTFQKMPHQFLLRF